MGPMPTGHIPSLQERFPREWAACRRATADAMVADGWIRHARKFDEVCRRRSLRAFGGFLSAKGALR